MAIVECRWEGCTETFDTSDGYTRRYCAAHRGGPRVQNAKYAPTVYTKVCAFEGCTESFETTSPNRKYCDTHYATRVRRQLSQELLFEEPRRFEEMKIRSLPDGYRVIIINDVHRPFQDDATLEAVERFWNDLRPNLEVYNGDIGDFYLISNYDQNPSRRFKLQDELDDLHGWLCRRMEANPDSERILIEGNHEDRLRRWLWRYGEQLAGLRNLELSALLGFDALKIKSLPYMSVLDLLGFRIEHGYRASASKAFPMNVSRYMAIATGSSGLCGHSHRFSVYGWQTASGSHSYTENGCLCRFDLEYAPFPSWSQAFTYGVVHNNKVHLVPVQIYSDGFRAEGEFYPRVIKRKRTK